jgi:hypothetical protein
LFVLAAPIVLGVAAMSATNNLLFIMVGAALGSIVISGLLSEANMRGVRGRIEPVSSVYAGEPARLRVMLERDLPSGLASYGLRVLERRGSLWRFIFRRPDPDLLDVTVPVLEERRAEMIGGRIFASRGRASLHLIELMCTYPFGLLTKFRDLDVDLDVVVRPKRVPVPEALRDPRALAAEGEISTKRGVGIEVYGLREHREGDAHQRIHALRSLALGQDVIVETTGMERPTAHLGIANDEGADPEAFERALEIAAAVLVEWDRRGYAVGLSTVRARYYAGTVSLDRLLDLLAMLSLEPAELRGASPAVWIVPEGAISRGTAIPIGRSP